MGAGGGGLSRLAHLILTTAVTVRLVNSRPKCRPAPWQYMRDFYVGMIEEQFLSEFLCKIRISFLTHKITDDPGSYSQGNTVAVCHSITADFNDLVLHFPNL